MSRRIIGVTVGTPMSPESIGKKLNMIDILPVTNADNGKILKVQSGNWSVAEDDATPLSNFDIENLLKNFV